MPYLRHSELQRFLEHLAAGRLPCLTEVGAVAIAERESTREEDRARIAALERWVDALTALVESMVEQHHKQARQEEEEGQG